MPKRKQGRPKQKKRKWLVARKLRGRIIVLGWSHRHTTKAKAQKDASKLNKRIRKLGAKGIKYVVRRVGWRRKRWHS